MNTAAQSDCFRNYWLLLILRASTLLLHSIQILQDMTKHSFRPTLFPLLLLLAGSSLPGQNAAQGIDYPAFLEKLAAENLSFAAEKYNISMAEAGVQAARALPDPELSFIGYNNQEQRLGMGYGFETELSWTLELGGKRAARKQVAAAQLTLAQLERRDFFRTLKKEATTAWLTVLKNEKEYKDLKETAEFLNKITAAKGNPDLRTAQDKLEVLLQNNRREHEQLLQEMNNFITRTEAENLYFPLGNLESEAQRFSEHSREMESSAEADRQKAELATRQRELAKAEAVMDLGVMIGVVNNGFAKNIIGPTPSYTTVMAGISIPLQLSGKGRAEHKIAELAAQKAQLQYELAQRERKRNFRERSSAKKEAGLKMKESRLKLQQKQKQLENLSQKHSENPEIAQLLKALDELRDANDTYREALYNFCRTTLALESL